MFAIRCACAALFGIFLFSGQVLAESLQITSDKNSYLSGERATFELTVQGATLPSAGFYYLDACFPVPSSPVTMTTSSAAPPVYRYTTLPLIGPSNPALSVTLWRLADYNRARTLDAYIPGYRFYVQLLQAFRDAFFFPPLRRRIEGQLADAQAQLQAYVDERNSLGPIASATKVIPVNIADTLPPLITVSPVSLTFEATGPLTPATLPIPSVTDNMDPNPVVTNNAPAGGFPLGTTTVFFTATDASGNSSTAPLFVTIIDTTPPAIIPRADVTVEAIAPLTAVPVPAPAVLDNHDIAVPVTHNAPAAGFPVGTTVVTFSATDLSGNTGTATMRITVVDTLPPSITVPANITAEATGPLTVVVLSAILIDDLADPMPTVNVGIPPFGFPLGTTVVPITVTDASGNTATAAWLITVEDTTPPSITPPADITVEATGVRTPVILPSPGVSDIVDASPGIGDDAPPGGFPLGTTIVTFSAWDDSGNLATAAMQVTVVDTTPPSVAPPADLVVEATGALTTVSLPAPSVSDLADPAPVIVNDAPAGGFPLGTTAVTFTATDISGNTGTAAMQVTVQDTTAPAILGPALVSVPNTGPLTSVDLSAITASDLVDSVPGLTNDAPAGGFPAGNTPVLFTAVDFSGNVATRSITVRVEAPATTDVTGTWIFVSSTGGERFPLALQLHQRADGSVLSYGLGTTPALTTLQGEVIGDQFSMPIELTLSGLSGEPTTVQVVAQGTVTGDSMTLQLSSVPGEVFTLARTTETLSERVVYFGRGADVENLENGSLIRMTVVLDSAGNFVTGNYSAERELDSGTNPLFGVLAAVTAFSEAAGTGDVGITVDAGCGGSGTLTAVYDSPERTYSGSYIEAGCATGSGAAAGISGWRTNTAHAALILALYAKLADDLEAGIAFAPAYSVFHPSYLHYGETRIDRLNELDAQVAAYDMIDVVFDRFRNLRTITSSAHPILGSAQSVDFHDRRSGVPAGGGPVEVFRDTDTTDLQNDELKYVALSGNWVIRGNRDAEPFGLGLPALPGDLRYQLAGVTPFGTHNLNHPEGHSGFDFELADGADLYAARGGRIIDIRENRTFPQQKNITLLSGSFLIDYQHVEAGTLPISVGTVVSPGDIIGTPAKPCCDDAMCGGSGCCAADYPEAQACASILYRELHFSVQLFGSGYEICPYDVLTDAAKTLLDPLLPDSFSGEELVEPFLCNDPQRNGDVFPMDTRWEKTSGMSATNPVKIRFTRNAHTDSGYSYQWLSAGDAVVAAGTVNFVRHDFNPHQINFDQAFPSAATYYGLFVVESTPHDAVLRLDVGSTNPALRPLDLGNADVYGPVIEQ